MIYSVSCEYGIKALTRLADRSEPGQYCLLRDILEGSNLPQHYVGKIFQMLVRERILASAKGRGGGFTLCRSPEDIFLRQIVEAIDGATRLKRCFLGFDECDHHPECPNHRRCDNMREQIDELLDNTTLAQLVSVMHRHKQSQRVASTE